MSALKIVLSLFLILVPSIVFPFETQAGSRAHFNSNYSNPINTSFFTNCPNPGGNQVAYYPEGWHWIAGESNLRWGTDSVNHIGSSNYVQCFCPLNKDNNSLLGSHGIQTNWLKVTNISEEQKNHLLSQGWILIQNGADFGLPSGQYLAKNKDFSCTSPSCLKKISQSNSATITNSITSIINTGKNQTSYNTGGSTTTITGNAAASITIKNNLNINIVK
jgi:hypothetical protein